MAMMKKDSCLVEASNSPCFNRIKRELMLNANQCYIINAGKLLIGLVGILIICTGDLLARTDSLTTPRDSIAISNVDSLHSHDHDHEQENDTTNLSIPLYNHGKQTLIPSIPYVNINKRELQFPPYSDLSEILYEFTPGYPLSLGLFGKYNHISMFGALPNNTNVRFNGRRFDDMAFNSTNLTHLPPEFMENIEIYVGSDAVIYGDNASGALINFQEMRYNTKAPYTRLWFQQAAFEYVAADAIFSQNFEKNWNLTLGVRAMAHDGNYDNTWLESWNVRANLRWNPSDRSSISFTQNYVNQGSGSNGGVSEFDLSSATDGELDIFDRLTANPIFPNMNERIFRYDATLSGSLFLAGDSASAVSGSVYFANFLWDNGLDEPFVTLNDSVEYYSRESYLVGAKGQYEQKLSDIFILRAGGDLYYNSMEETIINEELKGVVLSGFGHATFNINEALSLSGGVRLQFVRDEQVASSGAKLNYRIDDKSSLFFDMSRSERLPTAIEGFSLQREKNLLFLVGSKFDLGFDLSLGAFYRITNDPIMAVPSELNEYGNAINIDFVNAEQRNILGGYFKVISEPLEDIFFELEAQVHVNDENYEKLYPTLLADLKVYYELRRNRSVLRLGAEFGVISEFNGYRYFPLKKGYYLSEYTIGTSPMGLNVFARAKLGDAYVRISYDNILSSGYYYVSIYPTLTGNIRMTVSWPFFE
jgi:outer membrane receptor protein involved in Fe transport